MRGYKNFESDPHPGDLRHLVEIGYTENTVNENGYMNKLQEIQETLRRCGCRELNLKE